MIHFAVLFTFHPYEYLHPLTNRTLRPKLSYLGVLYRKYDMAPAFTLPTQRIRVVRINFQHNIQELHRYN